MNILLSHIDFGALVYGVLMFVGLLIMFWKLMTFRLVSLAIDIAVFALVFRLHGGSMQGGFAAMICAMLAGLFFPLFLRR